MNRWIQTFVAVIAAAGMSAGVHAQRSMAEKHAWYEQWFRAIDQNYATVSQEYQRLKDQSDRDHARWREDTERHDAIVRQNEELVRLHEEGMRCYNADPYDRSCFAAYERLREASSTAGRPST